VWRWKIEASSFSKSLNKTERNYKIHDKEILAVIRELKNWRHLLKGTKFKFKVWTNYKNLEYFMKTQKLNRKQAYWTLYLSRFDFILKYVLGTKIKTTRSKDNKVVKVIEEIKKTEVKVL